jgi:hypothetical protein
VESDTTPDCFGDISVGWCHPGQSLNDGTGGLLRNTVHVGHRDAAGPIFVTRSLFIEGWYLLLWFASSLSPAAVGLWNLAIEGANAFWIFLAVVILVSLNRLLLLGVGRV